MIRDRRGQTFDQSEKAVHHEVAAVLLGRDLATAAAAGPVRRDDAIAVLDESVGQPGRPSTVRR
jgi:hypothetical protein